MNRLLLFIVLLFVINIYSYSQIKHKIYFETQTGCTITKPDGSDFLPDDKLVEDMNDFEFKVKLDPGYNQSIPRVTTGGIKYPLQPNKNGVYTIPKVGVDKTITVSNIFKNKYAITLPEPQTGYTITKPDGSDFQPDDKSVEHGEEFKFIIKLNPEYSQSTPKVTVNGSPNSLKPDNGVYTITDIQEDQNVVVSNIDKNKYAITLPDTQTGYTITKPDGSDIQSDDKSVEHGLSFEFKVKLDPGYNQNTPKVTVNGSSNPLQPDNGVYTIPNVQDAKTITVSNLVKNKYAITLPAPQTGYTITKPDGSDFQPDDKSVEHGLSFEFIIKLNPEYSQSTPKVIVNGSPNSLQPANDGVYTITDIQENQDVVVSNIDKNEYAITLPDPQTGYTITKPDGNVFLPGELLVEHGLPFAFKVKLDPDYDKTLPTISVVTSQGTTLLQPGLDGVYTILSVIESMTIEVKVKQNIRLQIVPATSCTILPSTILQVKEGDDLQFTVKRSPGFEGYAIELTVDKPDLCGEISIDQSTGLCTIRNMQANLTIVVTYRGEHAVYPTTNRKIELYACEGLTLTPQPGTHFVPSGTNFSFTYTVNEGYRAENIHITTGYEPYDTKHLRVTKESDGSSRVTVYAIRRELHIRITGAEPTSDVGNEAFATEKSPSVWGYGQTLYIRTTQATSIAIYDLKGVLYKKEQLPAGLTSYMLPTNIYLVVVGNNPAQKVVVE